MKALIVGATGLIGKQVLEILRNDPEIESVTSLNRKKDETEGKVSHKKIDFDNLNQLDFTQQFDIAFCCLGTTIKIAKTKENFKKVDYQYVVDFAELAKENGVKSFSVISAMGANAKSSIFYNKVKGEMEEALQKVGIKGLLVLRPSLLLGDRKESRFGEKVGEVVMWLLKPIFIGSWRNYAAVQSKHVAQTMVHATKTQPVGLRLFSSAEFKLYANLYKL
jgi:uncharacterized protein YbjT (DUF2867 family)